jgi:hypothetical protein
MKKSYRISSDKRKRPFIRKAHVLLLIASITSTAIVYAQDGTAGLNQANGLVRGYFAAGTTLLYAIGGVVGLVGAIKVYNAWSHGDPQTNKLAASWFGACIFLVVVAATLKSFFGIT